MITLIDDSYEYDEIQYSLTNYIFGGMNESSISIYLQKKIYLLFSIQFFLHIEKER